MFAPPGPPKSAEALASYAANGSGTVQGKADREKAKQIAFWQAAAKDGITDAQARDWVERAERALRFGDELLGRLRMSGRDC